LDYVSVVHIHAPGLLLPTVDHGTSVNAVVEPYAELLGNTSKDYGIFSSGGSIRSYTTEALAWDDTIPYLSDTQVDTSFACNATVYNDWLAHLMTRPHHRFSRVMLLEVPSPRIYRIAAVGLEGAGKSTTLMNLAEHAQVKHPFDVGYLGGISFTQRMVSARVGQFELIDTKGLPSHDTRYVENIQQFLDGHVTPGAEIIWEDLTPSWRGTSPKSAPVDGVIFVVRYTKRPFERAGIRSFLSALAECGVPTVVAVTHLSNSTSATDLLDFAQSIENYNCIGLPIINDVVSPHSLATLMETLLEKLES